MKHLKSQQRQKGIALITTLIFVVILIAVIMAVVATSRTTASATSDQTAKMRASGIIDEGNMLKIGFDVMQASGVTIDNITFGAVQPNDATYPTIAVGLFNTVNGTAVTQSPPPGSYNLTVAGAGKWMWARGGATAQTSTGNNQNPALTGVKWPAVGAALSANQYAVILTGITDPVCKQINLSLRGYDSNAAIPISGKTAPTPLSIVVGNQSEYSIAAQFDLSSIAFTGVKDSSGTAVTALTGYSVCATTTGGADQNVYVNVVKAM